MSGCPAPADPQALKDLAIAIVDGEKEEKKNS